MKCLSKIHALLYIIAIGVLFQLGIKKQQITSLSKVVASKDKSDDENTAKNNSMALNVVLEEEDSSETRSDTVVDAVKNSTADETMKDEGGERIRMPRLIFHIGPQKTGTSTIQCELYRIEKQLNKDNVYYIGSFIPHMGCGGRPSHLKTQGIVSFNYHDFFACLNAGKTSCKKQQNGQRFQSFVDVLEYHRAKGHDVVYSSEHLANFADVDGEDLWELLDELFRGFDVTVVFTYRHYFSWILSVFNEVYKQAYIGPSNIFTGDKWPGGKTSRGISGNVVGSIPSLSGTIDTIMGGGSDLLDKHARVYHALEKYQEHMRVEYFMMERPTLDRNASQTSLDGMVANFVCQIILDAENACSYLKSAAKEKGDTIQNNSVELEVDRLVTAVYEKGWFKNDAKGMPDEDNIVILRNGPIQRAFDEYLKDKKNDGAYPWECASKKDALLQKSIAIMHSMLQNETRRMVETQIRADFSDYADKHKFCNLDVNLLMETNESEIRNVVEKVKRELLEKAKRLKEKDKKLAT